MAVMAPAHQFIESVHGIRYQVRDVARAAEFYTQQLGYPDGNPIELLEPARKGSPRSATILQ